MVLLNFLVTERDPSTVITGQRLTVDRTSNASVCGEITTIRVRLSSSRFGNEIHVDWRKRGRAATRGPCLIGHATVNGDDLWVRDLTAVIDH